MADFTSSGNVSVLEDGILVTGGASSLDFDAGLTATGVGGDVTITASGSTGNMQYDDDLSSQVDGLTSTFTLLHAPLPVGSLILEFQGQIQGLTSNYTVVGTSLTLTFIPPAGSRLVAKQYAY